MVVILKKYDWHSFINNKNYLPVLGQKGCLKESYDDKKEFEELRYFFGKDILYTPENVSLICRLFCFFSRSEVVRVCENGDIFFTNGSGIEIGDILWTDRIYIKITGCGNINHFWFGGSRKEDYKNYSDEEMNKLKTSCKDGCERKVKMDK